MEHCKMLYQKGPAGAAEMTSTISSEMREEQLTACLQGRGGKAFTEEKKRVGVPFEFPKKSPSQPGTRVGEGRVYGHPPTAPAVMDEGQGGDLL